MVNINEEFPSKFLKSADLKGQTIRVKIKDVIVKEIGDERKMVMYFIGKNKGMVLNKTNALTIGEVYGADTDEWAGKEIELFSMKVPYQGKLVDGIRLNVLKRSNGQQQRKPDYDDGFAPDDRDRVAQETSKPRDAAAQAGYAAELDDDIPFGPERR